MQIGSAIYNHLGTGLLPQKRNTTHKASSLKEVYTSMSRYNKTVPLFMFSLSNDKQARMIGIKEAAISLQDISNNFQDASSAIYANRILHSDNEAIVSGGFRSYRQVDLPSELKIQIESLATEQSNVGHYVSALHTDILPGVYGLDIETGQSKAHFAVTVEPNDTNEAILNTLSTYINNRGIGINASVLHEDRQLVALMLSSNTTGAPDADSHILFTLADTTSGPGIVNTFGLNEVSTYPSNSHFLLNGEEHTSASNHISINQSIELDFHATSKEAVTVRFIPDVGIAREHAEQFINAYNSLVDLSNQPNDRKLGNRSLYNDLSHIEAVSRDIFATVGLVFDDKGYLTKAEPLFSESIKSGNFSALFGDSYPFRKDMTAVTKRLLLDPMAYIDKTMVSYPNTRNNTSTTYTQSNYSGMMFNNYV